MNAEYRFNMDDRQLLLDIQALVEQEGDEEQTDFPSLGIFINLVSFKKKCIFKLISRALRKCKPNQWPFMFKLVKISKEESCGDIVSENTSGNHHCYIDMKNLFIKASIFIKLFLNYVK